ncbi:MAG: PorV/PorQ family protein, partial [Elusimicrobiota bacterium]|nr:PorV/PorQ family protein [Elusimicrobiota bacterium]
MKKLAFLIILLLFSCGALYSSAESGAEFLKFETGARTMGMGGAFTGVADDINSIWWNPAGLGSLEFKEFTLMHNEAGEEIRHEFTSFVLPLSRLRGTLGGSLNYFSVGDIQGYDAGGVRTETLDAGSFGVNLAYGLNYLSPLYLGIKGGYIYEKLAGYDAYAFTVDSGILWDTPAEGLRLGLNFMNMGTGLKFVEEISPLPFNVKAGLSYSFKLYGVSAIAAADGNFPAYGKDYYSLGTELHFFDLVFLRAGYKTQDDVSSGIRLGAGLKNKNLLLDYAWLPRGDFNDSHRISLSLKLGRKFNETGIEAQIRNKFNRGVKLYNAGKIFEAYRIFRDLLLVAPRHEGVREYISRIELSVETVETASLIREAAREGKKYFNNDDLVRARSRFETILKLDPDNKTAQE